MPRGRFKIEKFMTVEKLERRLNAIGDSDPTILLDPSGGAGGGWVFVLIHREVPGFEIPEEEDDAQA